MKPFKITKTMIRRAAEGSNKMQRRTMKVASFLKYLKEHEDERFWQALRNWDGSPFIFRADELDQTTFLPKTLHDTFYDED